MDGGATGRSGKPAVGRAAVELNSARVVAIIRNHLTEDETAMEKHLKQDNAIDSHVL